MLKPEGRPVKGRKRSQSRWPYLLPALLLALIVWILAGIHLNVGGYSLTTGWGRPYPPIPNPANPVLAVHHTGMMFANLGGGRTIRSWIGTVRIGGAVFNANYVCLTGPPLPPAPAQPE